MSPVENCSGVAGVVGVSIAITALPVQTPFIETTSPLCTSAKGMLPLLLMLCMLMSTPCLNREAVTWPTPEENVQVICILCE